MIRRSLDDEQTGRPFARSLDGIVDYPSAQPRDRWPNTGEGSRLFAADRPNVHVPRPSRAIYRVGGNGSLPSDSMGWSPEHAYARSRRSTMDRGVVGGARFELFPEIPA
jgi:hypothetical protein